MKTGMSQVLRKIRSSCQARWLLHLRRAFAGLVVYKMSSVGLPDPSRYDLGFSGHAANTDDSRDNWNPHSFDQFHDGPVNGEAGTRRTLEMVIAAIRD
jgi:hypothetical protein